MEFKKVAILGGGLLGGSLALALEERFGEVSTSLWSRRPENVAAAKERGISGATGSIGEAVESSDLVILSTPVGAMASVLLAAQAAGLPPQALITDVGSVKASVHEVLRPILARTNSKFIGSHPMAGSEKTGVEAAMADLFSGAACLLTDDEKVGEPWYGHLKNFWEALGCTVYPSDEEFEWLTAEGHDQSVARISHFPHMMASVTAMVAFEDPVESAFGGGGLRDTTRVAGGNPEMWAEIAIENREALIRVLESGAKELSEMLDKLRRGDQEALRLWLAKARDRREQAKIHSEILIQS